MINNLRYLIGDIGFANIVNKVVVKYYLQTFKQRSKLNLYQVPVESNIHRILNLSGFAYYVPHLDYL